MSVGTKRPPSTTEPHGEHHDSHEEHPRWERSWKEWNDGWSSHDNWKTDDWKDHRWRSDDPKYDRPYISHLVFPKFDGRREELSDYQYAVMNLKSQCVPRDDKYLAPELIANFTGSMRDDAKAMELNATDFQVDDGVEQLLRFIRKRLHITDLNLETEAFDKYFAQLARKKGETLMTYINAEETAYRKLQRILTSATEDGEEEYSSDDESKARNFNFRRDCVVGTFWNEQRPHLKNTVEF